MNDVSAPKDVKSAEVGGVPHKRPRGGSLIDGLLTRPVAGGLTHSRWIPQDKRPFLSQIKLLQTQSINVLYTVRNVHQLNADILWGQSIVYVSGFHFVLKLTPGFLFLFVSPSFPVCTGLNCSSGFHANGN
jgi:hypothetical protein